MILVWSNFADPLLLKFMPFFSGFPWQWKLNLLPTGTNIQHHVPKCKAVVNHMHPINAFQLLFWAVLCGKERDVILWKKKIYVVCKFFQSQQIGKFYALWSNCIVTSKIVFINLLAMSQLQYVGSTTILFKVRLRNHQSLTDTTKKTSCEVAIHFNRTAHVLRDMMINNPEQISCNT